MKKFLFKQAASFPISKGLASKEFNRGLHEVGDEIKNHSFFKKLQKLGLVVETTNQEFDKHLTQNERDLILQNRIKAKIDGKNIAEAPKPEIIQPDSKAEPQIAGKSVAKK